MALYKMKITGNTLDIKIDMNHFKSKLVEQCEIQNKQAIRVWLKEALLHIPGYTGTARGTFIPVGRLVKRAVTRFRPGDPLGNAQRARKKKLIHYGGRTWVAGFQAGSQYSLAFMRTKRTGLRITNSFTFMNNLPYVARNDIAGPPPGWTLPSNPPWMAIRKATIKWQQYVHTEIPKRLKIPRGFIKITKVGIR